MNKLPISIVIPCSDDLRLKNCLASIDVFCDVVIALNKPTKEVKKIVRQFKTRFVEIDHKNFPKALNIGINETINNKVILMDSDCIFKKGAISKVSKMLDKHRVVKGHVIYAKNNFQSQIVSNYRTYVTYNPPKSYNPFLCFKKDIKSEIGGYIFNENIYWTEDAELSTRLKKAKIDFYYAKDAKAIHVPLSFKKDLNSAYKYGAGKARRVEMNLSDKPNSRVKDIFPVFKLYGLSVSIYSIIWNICYLSGFYFYLFKSYWKNYETT